MLPSTSRIFSRMPISSSQGQWQAHAAALSVQGIKNISQRKPTLAMPSTDQRAFKEAISWWRNRGVSVKGVHVGLCRFHLEFGSSGIFMFSEWVSEDESDLADLELLCKAGNDLWGAGSHWIERRT